MSGAKTIDATYGQATAQPRPIPTHIHRTHTMQPIQATHLSCILRIIMAMVFLELNATDSPTRAALALRIEERSRSLLSGVRHHRRVLGPHL